MCYTSIHWFYVVIYVLGCFFCLENLHQSLYNNSERISSPFRSLHNLFCHLPPSFSCSLHPVFHSFFPVQLSLLSLSLSRSIFPFSVLLWADFPMRCRRGGTKIREGITEKTSPVTNVSLAMLLPNFYNWSLWSHEWKMTISKALTDTKQVGESYSQAIRNLVQILECWSAVGLPAPVIKSFNPESTPSGKNNPWVLFSVFIWSETVR